MDKIKVGIIGAGGYGGCGAVELLQAGLDRFSEGIDLISLVIEIIFFFDIKA